MHLSHLLVALNTGLAAATALPRSEEAGHAVNKRITASASDPDGIYTATLVSSGSWTNITHSPLPRHLTARSVPVGPRAVPVGPRALPVNALQCTGTYLPQTDWSGAWSAFDAYCDREPSTKSALWVKQGVAVAFMCSWGVWNPCARHEYDEFVNVHIKPVCGDLTTGFADMKSWKKTYGRASVDQGFCDTHA